MAAHTTALRFWPQWLSSSRGRRSSQVEWTLRRPGERREQPWRRRCWQRDPSSRVLPKLYGAWAIAIGVVLIAQVAKVVSQPLTEANAGDQVEEGIHVLD